MIIRFIKGLLLTFVIFVFLDFFYFNLDNGTLGYPVQFEFNVPPFVYLKSLPIALGFLVIISFCLGMVFAIILGFVQSVIHHSELRASHKEVKRLEKRLRELAPTLSEPSADDRASF